jgi:hypothetical protein
LERDIMHLWERKMERIVEAAKLWLLRSKSSPLEITLKATDIYHPSPRMLQNVEDRQSQPSSFTAHLRNVVETVCDVSQRWRSLRLALSIERPQYQSLFPSHFSSLLHLQPDDVPNLEEVQFYVTGAMAHDVTSSHRPVPPHHGAGLLTGRSLRSVSLCPIDCGIETIASAWVHLTELRFSGYTGASMRPGISQAPLFFTEQEAFNLLRLCSGRVKCDLKVVADDVWSSDTGSWPKQPLNFAGGVRLPHLQSLILRNWVPGDGFASALDLPSLCILLFIEPKAHIGWQMPLYTEETSRVVEWVRCFGSQLTEIHFCHTSLTRSALEYCMEQLPNITSLTWSSVGNNPYAPGADPEIVPNPTTPLDDKFMGKMTPVYGADGVLLGAEWCPRLRKLEISGRCGGVAFTEKSLVDFITYRRATRASGTCRLQKVHVEFESYQKTDVPKELEERKLVIDGSGLDTAYKLSYPSLAQAQFRPFPGPTAQYYFPQDLDFI